MCACSYIIPSREQDRHLNIDAVAVLREDGLKDVQQMQYSPYGTSFRFLSSEVDRARDETALWKPLHQQIHECQIRKYRRLEPGRGKPE